MSELSRSAVKMRDRMRLVAMFVFIGLMAALASCYLMQITRHHRNLAAADDQVIADDVKIDRLRGPLLDRNYEKLTVSQFSVSLTLDPIKAAVKRDQILAVLTSLWPEEAAYFQTQLNRAERVFLKRKLTPEERLRVEQSGIADLPGIELETQRMRFSTMGEEGSRILGFVDIDDRNSTGIEQLAEPITRVYDLPVSAKRVRYRGQPMLIFDSHEEFDGAERTGDGAVLTLDRHIQHITEQALKKAMEDVGAKRGFAVTADPSTGEIYSFTDMPNFNPEDYIYVKKFMPSPGIIEAFEGGSIMKIVTIAAALDSGRYKPTTIIDIGYGIAHNICSKPISDSHGYSEHTYFSVEEVLVHSSNVGALTIGINLGAETLYRYLRAFGFGENTGIGLQDESNGLLRKPAGWTKCDLANISFGQGLNITVLQALQMVQIIANDGVMVPLRLIRGKLTPDGYYQEISYEDEKRRVISVETARIMKIILTRVLSSEGTGVRAAIDGVVASGKTGTAQRFDRKEKRYSTTEFNAWFVGLAPVESPKLITVILLDRPSVGRHQGGRAAGPAFKDITRDVLQYWGKFAVNVNSLPMAPRKEKRK